MKAAQKIQEFMNHGTVNAARFGRKTGQLVAAGGEDRTVSVWKLGHPSPVAQLQGHTSTVQSLSFDAEEESIVSGSSGGTIKVWDLNTQQLLKSFSQSHKTNVTCLDYHPFGQFFCSGSADTNIKVWDLRKKSCLQTYKGHTRQVNCVRFSPDGRWVASGGADGIVKLWDLTAGKQMEDFTRHNSEILCLDFHPNEFLLAVGSMDRTISFWDLDKFRPINQTHLDSKAIRCIRFTPDGSALCSSTVTALKVWAWEPVTCHDSLDVHWANVDDMHVNETTGELYGVASMESFVTIWSVRLQKLHPFSDSDAPSTPPHQQPVQQTVTRPVPPVKPQPQLPPQQRTPQSHQRPGHTTSDVAPAVHRALSPGTRARRLSEIRANQAAIQKRIGLLSLAEDEHGEAPTGRPLPAEEEPPRQPPPVAPPHPPSPSSHAAAQLEPPGPLSLLADHRAVCQMIDRRLTFVRALKTVWQRDKAGAIHLVQHSEDPALYVDFLRQVVTTKESELAPGTTLDVCQGVLPILCVLLSSSSHEAHLHTALDCTALLWRAFGSLVLRTLSARTARTDIAAEERADKCRVVHAQFLDAKQYVEALARRPDAVGQKARRVHSGLGL